MCLYSLIIIFIIYLLSYFSLSEIKEIPGQTSQRLTLNKEKGSPNVSILCILF